LDFTVPPGWCRQTVRLLLEAAARYKGAAADEMYPTSRTAAAPVKGVESVLQYLACAVRAFEARLKIADQGLTQGEQKLLSVGHGPAVSLNVCVLGLAA
jgi:hypothetical protein